MKLLLLLLLSLPLFGKQSERYYQEKFAREIGGEIEVKVHDTPVKKLSKYYLDCLNFDDVGGVQSITILERLAEREFLQS